MALEYRGPRAYASAGVDDTVRLGELVAGWASWSPAAWRTAMCSF